MAAGAGRLVSEKFAGVVTPTTDALTVYGPPAVAFAVNTVEVAMPLALVVAVFAPLAKVPLAPLPGAAKVTVTPLTGLLPASVTDTTRGAAKAVPTVAL
jgi:hypothetical protein